MSTVFRAALGAWFGAGLLFTMVVTPAIFRTLAAGQGATLLGALFPGFYAFSSMFGLVAVAAEWVHAPKATFAWGVPLAALLIQVISWLVLLPAVAAAEGTSRFGWLHGLSVVLEVVVLALVLLTLIFSVMAESGRHRPS